MWRSSFRVVHWHGSGDRLQSDETVARLTGLGTSEDHLGRRLSTVASYFGNNSLPAISGTSHVRCEIPRLNLGTGRYLLSVSISTKYVGLLDSLDCLAWFEVESCNAYGNGEPFHPVFGPILQDSFWSSL